MADCPLIENCPFFNDKMASMPTTSFLLKRRYCQTDHTTCARFMVYSTLGREKVPADLFPSDADKAKTIIGK